MRIYGWVLYASGRRPLGTSIQDDFVFDWIWLQSNWIRIRNIDYDDIWNIDFETYNKPQIDWWWVLSSLYNEKTVRLSLSLSAETVEDLQILIDNLKRRTAKTEWLLEIKVNWIVRQCKATRTELKFNRKYYNITFLPDVVLEFTTVAPHRENKQQDSISYTLTGDLAEDLYYTGTTKTFPIYNIILWWSGSASITGLTVTVLWISITITTPLTNNDVLIINSEKKFITLNWSELDYDWVFTPITYWNNIITFDFNSGATVNWGISILYNKKYY